MKRRIIRGIGLFVALSLFLQVVAFAEAVEYPQIGPQTADKYYYWGNDQFPKDQRQGISITLDESSISYETIKATVSMDWNLIIDRNIDKFVILANGVAVDEFEPYWDSSEGVNTFREVYWLDIDVDTSKIGSYVYFHVLGIRDYNSHEFVVAWSQETPTVRLKPFPVTDSDTHGYLSAILQKLNEMSESLKDKLDKLTKAVEDIYTPSPAAEARLDQAIDNFVKNLPMTQMKDQAQEIQNALEDARRNLKEPGSQITFGDKFDLVPGEGIYIYALDLTEWKEQLLLFRTIMQATAWLWFFQALFAWLSPKLGI